MDKQIDLSESTQSVGGGPPSKDLDKYIQGWGIDPSKATFSLEHDDERRARIRQEEVKQAAELEEIKMEAENKRKMAFYRFLVKEVSVQVLGVVILLILSLTSLRIIVYDRTARDEERNWARSTLVLIGTAIAGYLFGRASQSGENK